MIRRPGRASGAPLGAAPRGRAAGGQALIEFAVMVPLFALILFGMLEFVHRFKFVDGGDLIAGVGALIFVFVIAIGGAAVWWPSSWRALKASLKLNLRLRGRLRDVHLHRVTGAYAGIVILASALTGLPQAFDWYKDALYIIAGSPLPDRHFESKPDAGAVRLPMEAIWRHAQALVPSPAEALLHYPRKPDEAVEIYLIEKDAPHANARTYLFLDAYSNAVVSFTPYAESSLGHRLYFWTLSWHTGQAGLLGQVVLLFGALAVPVLAYTGIASYLARRRRAILLDQR